MTNEFLLKYAKENGYLHFNDVHERLTGLELHFFFVKAFNEYSDYKRIPVLVDKLSCKWVSCSERSPKLGFSTLMFMGGIPEPTKYVYYLDGKWFCAVNHKQIEPFESACWLDYSHSDYPNVKF
jgi:hypothetical protein